MGMFDDVVCNAKLPKPVPMDGAFQTKDMDCLLDTYTIHKDGSLTVNRGGGKGEQIVKFHGILNFYGHPKDRRIRMKEYDAKFTDGKLVNIEIIT